MLRTLLQSSENVFLIADGADHDDAGVGVLTHDAFDRFDAFHLRHGDVHEHDVGLGAVELRDGGQAVAGFTGHFPAEHLDHLDEIFAGEYGVVHYKVADGLIVFAVQRRELLHGLLLRPGAVLAALGRNWCPFGFVELVVLVSFGAIFFGLVGFFGAAEALASILRSEEIADLFERDDAVRVALVMAARGMPLTTQVSSLCAMAKPPAALITPRPSAPSSPMPVMRTPTVASENSWATEWKENVYGRTMTVDGCAVGENGHVAAGHTTNHHVAIAGADEHAAGEKQVAGLGFADIERAAFVEALCEHFGKAFGHVLHDENRARENPLEAARARIAVRWGLRSRRRWR